MKSLLPFLCSVMPLSLLLFQATQPPKGPAHRFHKLADGVYSAVATGTMNVGSNSAIIVNERDVLIPRFRVRASIRARSSGYTR